MSKRRSSKFCVKFDSEENNIFDNVRQIHTSRRYRFCESFDKLMLAVIKCVVLTQMIIPLKTIRKATPAYLLTKFHKWLSPDEIATK